MKCDIDNSNQHGVRYSERRELFALPGGKKRSQSHGDAAGRTDQHTRSAEKFQKRLRKSCCQKNTTIHGFSIPQVQQQGAPTGRARPACVARTTDAADSVHGVPILDPETPF